MTKCHKRPLNSSPQEPGSPVPILGQDNPLTCTSQVIPGPDCEGAGAGSDPGGPIRPVSPTVSPPRGAVPAPHLSVHSLCPIRGSPLDPSSTQNPPTAPPPEHESGVTAHYPSHICILFIPHTCPWVRPWGPTPLRPALTGAQAAPDHALGWWGSRPAARVPVAPNTGLLGKPSTYCQKRPKHFTSAPPGTALSPAS